MDAGTPTYSDVELIEIAKCQRSLLALIFLNLIGYLLLLVILLGAPRARAAGPAPHAVLFVNSRAHPAPPVNPFVRMALTIASICLNLVVVCNLANALRISAAMHMLAMFVPAISFVAMLRLNGRATRALQARGIHVGIMGASRAELEQMAVTA